MRTAIGSGGLRDEPQQVVGIEFPGCHVKQHFAGFE
jgi:hypothetical protein